MADRGNKRQRTTIAVTIEEYREVGCSIMNRAQGNERDFSRRWNAFFGVGPPVAVDTWNRLDVDVNEPELRGVGPFHLLWALMLLK